MGNEISVRPALLDDLDGIRNAYLASWRAGYAGILAPEELEAQAVIRAQLTGAVASTTRIGLC